MEAVVGPQQPTADGQREFLLGLELRVVLVLQEGRHAGQHFGVQPRPHLFQRRRQRRAVGPLPHLRQQGHAGLLDGLPPRLELLVFLLHLADGLQDFARHVFRGELLEDLLHQGVLPAFPPQSQLIEHLLGVHEPQLLQRGLKFLGDLRVVLEILEDLLQRRHRHAVALALEIETHDLLAVIEILGIDLVHEDLVEHLVGERARGDPHVPRHIARPRPGHIAA